MKVLMFGWEFPPNISGGLGTACYGLTRGLASFEDLNVTFVIPRVYGNEYNTGIKFIGAGDVELSGKTLVKQRDLEIRLSHDVGHEITAYITPEQYIKIIASQEQKVKEKVINPKFMNSISPITYVTKNSPPVFIVHGDADPTVPYSQSVALNQELENFGVVHQFFTVKDGGHGQFSPEDTKKVDDSIIEFLTELGLNKSQ